VAGLLYGASYAPVLQAQTAAATTSGGTLEEIVVTATRRAQTVQEIPFNISAVSGAALEKSNIIDSVDALRTMAGVAMYDRGYRNAGVTNGIIIRGMNVDAGTNNDVPLAAPPTVATYIDNTALFGNFVLKDIERIEVLRGPQGTLYGSGSLAGNVRYIMKKPDISALSAKASLSYGQTDGSDGHNLNPDLLVNIPLGTTAAFRANIGQVKNDGIVDYPNLYVLDSKGDPVVTGGDIVNALPVYRSAKDVDSVDLKYGRASLLLKPNATFNAQLHDWLHGDALRESGGNGHDRGSYAKSMRFVIAGAERVKDVAHYVRSLSGLVHDSIRAARGKGDFDKTCVACHGAQGKGNPAMGAPDLTDKVWLHGSSEEAIIQTISAGRVDQMPAHKDKLTPAQIHILAAYVYSLSRGGALTTHAK